MRLTQRLSSRRADFSDPRRCSKRSGKPPTRESTMAIRSDIRPAGFSRAQPTAPHPHSLPMRPVRIVLGSLLVLGVAISFVRSRATVHDGDGGQIVAILVRALFLGWGAWLTRSRLAGAPENRRHRFETVAGEDRAQEADQHGLSRWVEHGRRVAAPIRMARQPPNLRALDKSDREGHDRKP